MVGKLIGAVLLLCAGSGVSAQAITVQEVLGWCEEFIDGRPSSFNKGICLGMVAGVGYMSGANCSRLDEQYRRPLASDGNHSTGASVQAFVNWAHAHPEEWGMRAELGTAIAISETFPCVD